MADLKPLSDLAKTIWQCLVDRHSGHENPVRREVLYKHIISLDEYRNARNGKPVSFRAFRNAKYELVQHRKRVGSGPRGWFRILTPAEARASAAYLFGQIRGMQAEAEALGMIACEIEIENRDRHGIEPMTREQLELGLGSQGVTL